MMKTLCGLEKVWDQTFLDSLPGGSETSCENCLIIQVGGKEKPKRVRKVKP
jgi:hypothetical protein